MMNIFGHFWLISTLVILFNKADILCYRFEVVEDPTSSIGKHFYEVRVSDRKLSLVMKYYSDLQLINDFYEMIWVASVVDMITLDTNHEGLVLKFLQEAFYGKFSHLIKRTR